MDISELKPGQFQTWREVRTDSTIFIQQLTERRSSMNNLPAIHSQIFFIFKWMSQE